MGLIAGDGGIEIVKLECKRSGNEDILVQDNGPKIMEEYLLTRGYSSILST